MSDLIQESSYDSSPGNALCNTCPQADNCRSVWSKPPQAGLKGAALVFASGLAFLLPVITGIIAAAIARVYTANNEYSSLIQIAAAIVGLLGGILLASLLVSLIKRPRADQAETKQADSAEAQQPTRGTST